MLSQMNSRHILEKRNQTRYLCLQSRAHVRELGKSLIWGHFRASQRQEQNLHQKRVHQALTFSIFGSNNGSRVTAAGTRTVATSSS